MTNLKVSDCMSINPVTVGPQDSLQNVINCCAGAIFDRCRLSPTVGRLASLPIETCAKWCRPIRFRNDAEIRRYMERLTVTAVMSADPMTIA